MYQKEKKKLLVRLKYLEKKKIHIRNKINRSLLFYNECKNIHFFKSKSSVSKIHQFICFRSPGYFRDVYEVKMSQDTATGDSDLFINFLRRGST